MSSIDFVCSTIYFNAPSVQSVHHYLSYLLKFSYSSAIPAIYPTNRHSSASKMQLRDIANLALISVVLLATGFGVDAASAPQHITDPKQNYTISGDNVVLHSLVGDIKIPMPDFVKAELRRERNAKIKPRRVTRQLFRPNFSRYNLGWAFADFFECNEQAQIALSPYTENHRYWEAFFKRNSVNNTLAVSTDCFCFIHLVYNSLNNSN